DRLGQLSLLRQGHSQVVMGFGEVRLIIECEAEMRDCLIELPPLGEQYGDTGQCLDMVRLQAKHFAETGERPFVLALAELTSCELILRAGIARNCAVLT